MNKYLQYQGEITKMKRIRSIIHKAIVRYLRHCGGSFHCGGYGEDGRYALLTTEIGYHIFKNGPQDYGLMQIYKDKKGYFVALPGFSNSRDSLTIGIPAETATGWPVALRG